MDAHAAPPSPLGAAAVARVEALAAISDAPDGLTRLFLSPAHRRAADAVAAMLREAGCDSVRVDALGTVVGRYEGHAPGARALLIGSHLDSVRDAGRWDGPLGVVAGIGVVEALAREGTRLPFAVEVLAFGDEENVRWPTNLASSRALAGSFDPAWLDARDEEGTRLADALTAFGGDPAGVAGLARDPYSALAYLEVHIEQGPVLEAEGLALGVVSSIASIARLELRLTGEAGHAGTVPMRFRRDAGAAAFEVALAAEREARAREGAVATVGRLALLPGAPNVIPGRAVLTIDARAPGDATRADLVSGIEREARGIAARRGVGVEIARTFDAPALPCDPAVMAGLERAVGGLGIAPRRLPSGAGHDAMAMARLCPSGMLFVRCRGGVSHNPAEHVEPQDADAAVTALLAFVRDFRPNG